MARVEWRDFETPDETRTPDKTTVELVSLAGGQIGRYTFQPGWRWSECIKPVVQTDTCQVEHIGYVVSGSLHVEHEASWLVNRPPIWVITESSIESMPNSGSFRYSRSTTVPISIGLGRGKEGDTGQVLSVS